MKSLVDIPETALVRLLIAKLRRTYDAFGFMFDGVRPQDARWQYMFLAEVPRNALGLDSRLQPGDFDVIIVASIGDKLLIELTAAIEVKRLALRSGVIDKNVDRYGITKGAGLLRDGFPLAGVLHLVSCDPGPPENMQSVQVVQVVEADTQQIEYVREGTADLTALHAGDRQISRLAARTSDPRLGLHALAMQRSAKSRFGIFPSPSFGKRPTYNTKFS